MEFREGLVANETQYFADRFEPACVYRKPYPSLLSEESAKLAR
jgi:hypothetical protein